jgi:prepilin-type N-terminal cleavage/methylation domain-containing protein
MTSRRAERGYSLVEMLVVVAIIGIISLVTVPQFMTFARQGKMRGAVRQFNSDLRVARQRAITRNIPTAVSFVPGEDPDAPLLRGWYAIFDQNGTDWTLVGNWKQLPEAIYFDESDFAADAATEDELHDIVFRPNGTVANMPAGVGVTPTVDIISTYDMPNNHCVVTLNVGGTLSSAFTTD